MFSYELKDIHGFLLLARCGSISRAAAAHGIPKATLSHHLSRLEDALKVELFLRKPRGLELTEAGREYQQHCRAILDSCEAAASAAQSAHSRVEGRVRIVASGEFGTTLLGAAAHRVALQNPHLDFDLRMTPNDTLLSGQVDFDCMLYVGKPPDSALLCRKLTDVASGVYAAPSLAASFGGLAGPEDLQGLPGAVYHRSGVAEAWALQRGRAQAIARPYERYRVNEYWMAKYFAVEGSAIAYLPDFFVTYEVQSGSLVPLLPEWRSKKTAISLLYPKQRHRNPRLTGLIDTLCVNFHEFIAHPRYALVKR